jgi:hypothetical protein
LTAEQNTWGIGGPFDEDVFAAKTVFHYGQVVKSANLSMAKIPKSYKRKHGKITSLQKNFQLLQQI